MEIWGVKWKPRDGSVVPALGRMNKSSFLPEADQPQRQSHPVGTAKVGTYKNGDVEAFEDLAQRQSSWNELHLS